MEIRLVSIDRGLLFFRCKGSLGHSIAADSPCPLRTLLANQSWVGNVLLDLREIDAVGTESVAWLIHWHRRVTKAGGVLGLCNVPVRFADFFALCQLQRLIPIWEDETAARAALASPRAAAPAASPAPATRHAASAPVEEAELREENGILPMPDVSPAVSVSAESRPEAGERPRGKVVDVLVVDDSSVDRLRAGNALEASGRAAAAPERGMHVLYAGNGREALTILQQKRPKLVVTDLMMPGLDGLGLVKEVRATYPSVPVVLMTAHGSEEIAAAAMRAGAASYVPKKYLARDLAPTVEMILRLAEADREQLIFPHLVASEYRFVLPNDPALVSPLVDFLQGHLERVRLCHGVDVLRVAIALREALVNAITHGNLEVDSATREADYAGYLRLLAERQNQAPYRDRRVHVTASETPREVVYTIRDEGPGFDTRALPDPTDPENFKKATGRGLYLVRTFMDEVRFNDSGNEVILTKRRSE